MDINALGPLMRILGRLALTALCVTTGCAPAPPPAGPYAALCSGLAIAGPLPLDSVTARDGSWVLRVPSDWAEHEFDSLSQRESWSSKDPSLAPGRLDLYLGAPPGLPPGWPTTGDLECALPAIGDGVVFRHYVLPAESPLFVSRVEWPHRGTVIATTPDDNASQLLAVASLLARPR